MILQCLSLVILLTGIASTPGFNVPPSTSFTVYKAGRSETSNTSRRFQPSSIDRSELLVRSSDHPKLDYHGGDGGLDSSERLLRHYVGVLDPQTGELQVVEARKVAIHAVLRNAEESEEEDEQPIKSVSAPFFSVQQNFLRLLIQAYQSQALKQELGRAFGTKKARKAIASLTENAITPNRGLASSGASNKSDAVSAALLESMSTSAADTLSREQLHATSEDAKPRPKANPGAQQPEDVYPVETLVGIDTLKVLMVKEWEDAARSVTPVTTKSRFVSQRLLKVARSGNIKKLKTLRYLLLLLDFFFALKPTKTGSKKLPDREELRRATAVQDFLIDGVRKRFADGR